MRPRITAIGGDDAMSEAYQYGQFCPVAMTLDVLGGRWTFLILRELLCGSTRFNELRRGLPRMSPALLSKRLKELEKNGLVARKKSDEPGIYDYVLTPSGMDTKDMVFALGHWGQRWVETKVTLKNLDPSLLMWDMRRNLKASHFPNRRVVVQFVYRDLQPATRDYWLIVEDGCVDLCNADPGFEIDVFLETDLGTMTKIWMGLTSVRAAVANGSMALSGDRRLADRAQEWLGLSYFAGEQKRVA
jgi:DNA-binding HxlR family transcriptional regulator